MNGVECGRPGCDGLIEDGYCDTCGMAATSNKTSVTATAAPAGAAHTGSADVSAPDSTAHPNTASSRTGSARGSAVSSLAQGTPLATFLA